MSGLQQLLTRFHRTRPGDDHDLRPTNLDPIDNHDRALGVDLLTHQLEGLRDGDHIVHTGCHLQRFNFVTASATNSRDNGALGAARDMGVVTGLANALDHMLYLILGRFLGHVDDHRWGSPFIASCKTKAAISDRGLQLSWLCGWPLEAHLHTKLHCSRAPNKSVLHGKSDAWSKSCQRSLSA